VHDGVALLDGGGRHMARGGERGNEVAADEARGAGDEDAH